MVIWNPKRRQSYPTWPHYDQALWYPEPSNFPYTPNQYHDMDFSTTSDSKAALKKLCGLEGKGRYYVDCSIIKPPFCFSFCNTKPDYNNFRPLLLVLHLKPVIMDSTIFWRSCILASVLTWNLFDVGSQKAKCEAQNQVLEFWNNLEEKK